MQPAYLPLARAVFDLVRRRGGCTVIGISGAQGAGKSTLSNDLAAYLRGCHLRPVVLSLDDFYLPKTVREQLGATVHPLLRTRGVPGTHDMDELGRVLAAMKAAEIGERVTFPRFDKSADDRARDSGECEGPVDVVLFEGWCVGARAEAEAALAEPVNRLEREEDPAGAYRRYVNGALASRYAPVFAGIDALVFLEVPSMAAVHGFRRQQEEQLRKAKERGPAVMTDEQLTRFIAHFERLTLWMLAEVPGRADAVVHLAPDRGVTRLELRPQGAFSTAS